MDIICQAKSGMGKTAVFVLATLNQMEPKAGEVSVVVLAHTRELAYQICKEFNRFSKYMPSVKTAVLYGGSLAGFVLAGRATPVPRSLLAACSRQVFPSRSCLTLSARSAPTSSSAHPAR